MTKLGWRAVFDVGRTFVGIVRRLKEMGFEKPVPFEATLGVEELSRVLRESASPDARGHMGLWVWFDVRNTQEPQALVMLEDVTIGRTKIPGSDWSEPKASAVDEVFADGTLDVRREDGHMVGFELSYGGITDEDDEDDD